MKGTIKSSIALVVADMQHPVTPILKAALVGERLHDTRRMIARLIEVIHHGAAMIKENLLRIGAMEVYLGHVHHLQKRYVAARSHRCRCPRRHGPKDGRDQDEFDVHPDRADPDDSISSGLDSLGFAQVDEPLSFLNVRHFSNPPSPYSTVAINDLTFHDGCQAISSPFGVNLQVANVSISSSTYDKATASDEKPAAGRVAIFGFTNGN